MADQGIVRNRAKIEATINNARRMGELTAEFGSFARYAWGFEPRPRRGAVDRETQISIGVAPEAMAMSKDLRRRGWGFVGPTTVFSFMEAMGLVNDHVRGCAAGREVERIRRTFARPGGAAREIRIATFARACPSFMYSRAAPTSASS